MPKCEIHDIEMEYAGEDPFGGDIWSCQMCVDEEDYYVWHNEAWQQDHAELYGFDDDPPGHTGFYTDVDGEAVHFLADPNMSDETMDALKEMVRAVKKALDNGWRPKR